MLTGTMKNQVDEVWNGAMEPKSLYQPPFTNLHVDGVHAYFNDEQAGAIVNRLHSINETATAKVV